MEGTPLCKLVLRLPNRMHFTNASVKALRGHNFLTVRTWIYLLPDCILKHSAINHLEFMANLLELLLAEFSCSSSDRILLWIGNFIAVTWLKKQPRSGSFATCLHRVLGLMLQWSPFTLWGTPFVRETQLHSRHFHTST